jgi:hypothetical protein
MNKIAAGPADIHTPLYDNPTIAKIAGIEAQILLGWRRRHGFLGGMLPGKQGSGGYLHSLIQALVAVAVAAMVRRGLDVENAVAAEAELAMQFEILAEIAGEKFVNEHRREHEEISTIFGYHPKGRDPKTKVSFYFFRRENTLDQVMKAADKGLFLLDLQAIMEFVLKRLKVSHLVKIDFVKAPK